MFSILVLVRDNNSVMDAENGWTTKTVPELHEWQRPRLPVCMDFLVQPSQSLLWCQ